MSQKFKKKFTASFIDIDTLDQSNVTKFDELIQTSTSSISVKEGAIIIGTVVALTNDIVVVDVGLKNEGRIPLAEFKLELNKPGPQIGDQFEIYVDKIEGINNKTVLSRAKAIRERAWKELEKNFRANQFVNGTIFSRVKGGFAVDVEGVVAFLPGSQVDLRPVDSNAISLLIGLAQPFKILKMDNTLGNVVVSRRAVLEEQRFEAKKDLLNNIVEGQTILEGVVKNITDYGAFVDLGSIDALLHITDISWRRINHPLEFLEIGQSVKVKVIKFDKETLRLHVGMKQLLDSPWQQIANDFPIGKVMRGKISNVTDYGAFVELREGIEGLIHSSEISWSKNIQNPNKVLKINQEVDFLVKEIDIEKHKVSLSIKRCRQNPWIIFAGKHKVGDVLTTNIRNVTDIGIFAALDEEIDGIIHLSDISWEVPGPEALKSYSKDQQIQCKILMIDVDKEQVRLSIKQLQQDPYEKFIIEPFVPCVVVKVEDEMLEVRVGDHFKGIIKKAELAIDRAEQKTNLFTVGQTVNAKALHYDKNGDVLVLSIKALELEEQENAIKTYGSIDSGVSLAASEGKEKE